MGELACRLARESVFGEELMGHCTVQGLRGNGRLKKGARLPDLPLSMLTTTLACESRQKNMLMIPPTSLRSKENTETCYHSRQRVCWAGQRSQLQGGCTYL